MKVTICQLSDQPVQLAQEWPALVEHVTSQASDLVLLPEMPFHPWLASVTKFDPQMWQEAVAAHEGWLPRLRELAPAMVIATRPVVSAERRQNEGFVWDAASGCAAVHTKYYLPDEEGFWEATWYEHGSGDFKTVVRRDACIGLLICTEMWFTEHARAYARSGAHLLACPRATLKSTGDKWLAGGRAAAVMSGAYCLSSNRGGVDTHGFEWGGCGWIIEPEEGDVLAVTSAREPFLTLDVDLTMAEKAKRTYPRYVRE